MNSAQRAASRNSSLGALGYLDEVPQIPADPSGKPSMVMAEDHLLRHRAEWKKKEKIWGANERHLSLRPEMGSFIVSGPHSLAGMASEFRIYHHCLPALFPDARSHALIFTWMLGI